MKFVSYPPCEQLKRYVKQLVVSENSIAQTYKVLPGTSLVMGFQYIGRLAHLRGQTPIQLAKAGVTGLMDSFRLFKNTAHIGTILVIFKETGAAAFLKMPVHELFSESLSLDHFFDRIQLAETEEKLCAANGDQQRIRIVEQLLINHLREIPEDYLVTEAINQIKQSNGTLRITQLARYLNISQSPLEKRFRKVVGASPKKFSSIVRIGHTLSMLTPANYQETIFLAGYHDQAHFIKDFKTFTGNTPQQFVKEKTEHK
ncbi:MAG TPA: helix-turn-helix domain-containing protein [Mucilaginibacter sp.]